MTRDEWKERGQITKKLPKKQLPKSLVERTKENLDSETADLISALHITVDQAEETHKKARQVAREVEQRIE